jgi:transposase
VPRLQPSVLIHLSRTDIDKLENLAASRTAPFRVVQRAKLILRAADGESNHGIARALDIGRPEVIKWRRRFAAQGMDGLADLPRSGRPPTISSLDRHRLLAIACKDPREFGVEQSSWSINTIYETAVHGGLVGPMGTTSIWRILNQVDLKPHRFRMWLHSKDPMFEEKMRDIVGLYLNGPQGGGAVVCVDEKTSIQALERIAPVERPSPGKPGRFEHEYIRHGTLCLFAAFDVLSGDVFGWTNPTRKGPDFLSFLDRLALHYPKGPVHVIVDNLNTHKGQEVDRWNERHGNRFVFHYTPTHASWLNQVEIWFSILGRRRLKNASFSSKEELQEGLLGFIADWNRRHTGPFEWTFKGYPLRSFPEVARERKRRHDDAREAINPVRYLEAPATRRGARMHAWDVREGAWQFCHAAA